MSHRLVGVFAAVTVLAFFTSAALAEPRLALVIGNSAYQNNKPLNNPANDAEAVAKVLNTAGFEAVMAFDLSRDLMKQTIEEFAARIKEKGPDSVVLVYYAGHGLQVDGENFLVPVDVKLQGEEDVPEQGVKLADVMEALEAAPSKMRIVILDACRNNPFAVSGEASGKGLAIVDAPTGSIVAYSTAPGTEAFDGSGRHSPYAAAFMRTVKQPNMPIEQVFKKVRLLVNESTDSKQTPWESSSLTSDFVFFANAANNGAISAVPAKIAITELGSRPVQDAYEAVIAEDSVEYYEEFVRLYPTDPRCNHVRRQLSRRQQMIAWQNVTYSNSPQEYASFASRFGDSDLVRSARRRQERPRVVNIAFPKRGEGRFGDGRFGGGRINIGNVGSNRPVIAFPQGNSRRPANNQPQGGQNNSGSKNSGLPQTGNAGINPNAGRPVIKPEKSGSNSNNNANNNNSANAGRNPAIPFPRGQENKGPNSQVQDTKKGDAKGANTPVNLPKNVGINPNANLPVIQGRTQNRGNETQGRPANQSRRPDVQRQPQVLRPAQVQRQVRQSIPRRQANSSRGNPASNSQNVRR